MGFMGRGKNRGGGRGRGGGIHASTRKHNEAGNESGSSGFRGRNDQGQGGPSGRNRPQTPEIEKTGLGAIILPTESLRITVGNDIYNKQKPRSPLANRLGPPVDQENQTKDLRQNQFSDDSFDNEARFYSGGESRRADDRNRSYGGGDQRHKSSHGGTHDRDRDKGRGRHNDNRKEDRYSSRDNESRSSDSRYHDRQHEGNSRNSDNYHRDRDRGNISNDRRHSDRDQYSYRQDSPNIHDKRTSADNKSHGDLGVHKDSQPVHRTDSFDSDPYNNQGRTYGDITQTDNKSYPSLPPAPKPLKSILKKAPQPTDEASPATFSQTPGQTLFPIINQKSADTGMSQKSHYDQSRGEARSKTSKGLGLPGMSSYMDIEDEEKFLYGDEKTDKLPSDHRSTSRMDRSPPRYQQSPERSALHDQYDQRFDSGYSGYQRDNVASYQQSVQSAQYAPPIPLVQEVQQQPQPNLQQQPLSTNYGHDLLSMFTGNQVAAPQQQVPVFQPTPQPVVAEEKQPYDPTIENILKSIGFDFEMSKRMQEKASTVQPKTPVEMEAQAQFGINQSTSFLGGGLPEDIKSKLFKRKEESIVDILIREAKEGPSDRKYDREENFDRDKMRDRDVTSERFDESYRGHESSWDRDRMQSRSVESERLQTRSRERSHSIEHGKIPGRLRERSRSIEHDRLPARSRDRSVELDRLQARSRDRFEDRLRDRSRSRDRRLRSRSRDRNMRSRSRDRSIRSRSRDRSIRSRSRDRRMRSNSRDRSMERSRERGRSPDRSRDRKRSRDGSLDRHYNKQSRKYSSRDSSLSSISSSSRSPSPITDPLVPLSSGITFQRHTEPAPTQEPATYPPYSAPYSQPPPYHPVNAYGQVPMGGMPPYGPPPHMGGPPMYPGVPPGMPPHFMPPPNYMVPPPPMGGYPMGGPMGHAAPGVYPPGPPQQEMNPLPPGSSSVPVALPKTSNVTSSSSSSSSSKRKNTNLLSVPVDKSESKKSNQSKKNKQDAVKIKEKQATSKGKEKEVVSERKTISIEKKTITVKLSESNRTVLPPKIDANKVTSKDAVKKAPESTKRPTDSPKKTMTASESKAVYKERDQKKRKMEVFEKELNKLKKQQNELMRKKRRQKDGHKDPILMQNSKLQDEIQVQISKLRNSCDELTKQLKGSVIEADGPPSAKKLKTDGSPSRDSKTSSQKKTVTKDLKRENSSAKQDKSKDIGDNLEFYDAGDHWCSMCNVVCGSIYSVLQHLHSKTHLENMDAYSRPWVPDEMKSPKKPTSSSKNATVLPVKGQEFLVPSKAFYCTLCKEFAGGDDACADFHLKTKSHYLKYQAYLEENPYYEKCFQLDKASGVGLPPKIKNPSSSLTAIPPKKVTAEDKHQADKRVREKERKWEKPVEELGDSNQKPMKQQDIFSKFSYKEKPEDKNATDKSDSKTEKSKTKTEKSDTKTEKEPEISDNKPSTENSVKEKGKIAINIINKGGIKTAQPASISATGKKNNLLPPWESLSKPDSKKPVIAKGEFPIRKVQKAETGKPASLSKFLSIENAYSKAKPLPVVKDSASSKPKVTAQDILKAFSGKLKDENAGLEKEASEKKENSKEELADLKLLGIDPTQEKPLAEKKAPPPPSQNLYLPKEDIKKQGHAVVKKNPNSEVPENKVSQPASPNLNLPTEELVKKDVDMMQLSIEPEKEQPLLEKEMPLSPPQALPKNVNPQVVLIRMNEDTIQSVKNDLKAGSFVTSPSTESAGIMELFEVTSTEKTLELGPTADSSGFVAAPEDIPLPPLKPKETGVVNQEMTTTTEDLADNDVPCEEIALIAVSSDDSVKQRENIDKISPAETEKLVSVNDCTTDSNKEKDHQNVLSLTANESVVDDCQSSVTEAVLSVDNGQKYVVDDCKTSTARAELSVDKGQFAVALVDTQSDINNQSSTKGTTMDNDQNITTLAGVDSTISKDVKKEGVDSTISKDVKEKGVVGTISSDVKEEGVVSTISSYVKEEGVDSTISSDVKEEGVDSTISSDVKEEGVVTTVSSDVRKEGVGSIISSDVRKEGVGSIISSDVREEEVDTTVSSDVRKEGEVDMSSVQASDYTTDTGLVGLDNGLSTVSETMERVDENNCGTSIFETQTGLSNDESPISFPVAEDGLSFGDVETPFILTELSLGLGQEILKNDGVVDHSAIEQNINTNVMTVSQGFERMTDDNVENFESVAPTSIFGKIPRERNLQTTMNQSADGGEKVPEEEMMETENFQESDIDDNASDSSVSMHMGSDFEVIDECEEDL